MATRIFGRLGGTRRNPTVILEMAVEDAQKLLFICENDTIIAEAMEFIGMKHGPVIRALAALKKGINQAGVKVYGRK